MAGNAQVVLDPAWKDKVTECLDRIGLTLIIRRGQIVMPVSNSKIVDGPEITACLEKLGLLSEIRFGEIKLILHNSKVVGFEKQFKMS